MESTITKGQIQSLIDGLFLQPVLTENSNIISLTSNELADILLRVSQHIRTEQPIDELLENIISILGNTGIAERVLLFQVNGENKVLLTHYWESPYVSKFNPVGFELDLSDLPLLKTFSPNSKHSFQIEDILKYLILPNYILKNKLKALFLRLKSKSLLVARGSSDNIKLVLNFQFCTRNIIWSNEIEKVIQSVIDQLVIALQSYSDKKKKESLQRNITELQESAIKEQEELLCRFASDLHDLPCSIIPNLKLAIKNKDLEECERLVDDVHNSLRQLINEYIVPDINLLGFVNTLYQFINGFKKTFKGKVLLELPDEEINISHKKATELFKVIREWFCNIEKHSNADIVEFKLKKSNDHYFLITISDNGRGFDTNDTKNLGYGILNMKKRLLETNSKFEIKSEINKGATLKIQTAVD